jgi:putative heme iron utilization protein
MTRTPAKSPLLPTDDTARALARTLLHDSRTAALATLDAAGAPFVSLVGCACLEDGTPLLLVSQLSQHTMHMLVRPSVSLLFSNIGKGDPLAHPRLSLSGRAEPIPQDNPQRAQARRLYLDSHPKAQLYIDFADFILVRIRPEQAALNGGFGRAYSLTPDDLQPNHQK